MSSDNSSYVYQLHVEDVRVFSHDLVTDMRIQRVTHSDFPQWSEGDWLLMEDGEIMSHFKDGEHIDEDYIENWFDGYIDGFTQ